VAGCGRAVLIGGGGLVGTGHGVVLRARTVWTARENAGSESEAPTHCPESHGLPGVRSGGR
jgi:hypothetical protein